MLAQAQKITTFAILLALPGCRSDYHGDGSTSGTTGGSTGSTGVADTETGGAGETGGGPGVDMGAGTSSGDGEPYEPCLADGDCGALWPTCLVPDASVTGFCSSDCTLVSECSDGATGSAQPVCHDLGLCMLSCNAEKPCPDGMACTNESFTGWNVGGVCTWP